MLVFDIETGPLPEAKLRELMPECDLPKHPGEFNPAGVKYGNTKDEAKKKEKLDEAKAKHAAAVASYEKDAAEKKAAHEANFIERAALNAGTGQVLAIGYFKGDEQPIKKLALNENPNDDDCERSLLTEFWKYTSELALARGHRMVGHNIIGFDLPFLMRRSWLLGVPMPDGIMKGRYFHESFIDTMQLWSCGAYNGFIGLGDLARYLGVGEKNGNGADFARLFREDRVAAMKYLKHDMMLTHAVAERLGVR